MADAVADPVTMVIFGGGGDLAHRKLLPALYNLSVDGFLPPHLAIVGVGRNAMSDEAYRDFAKDGTKRFSRRTLDEKAWTRFAASIFFVNATIDDRGLAPLGARLDVLEHERGLPGHRLYYLAVPPALFVPTVKQLAHSRMVRPDDRLVVEKPIGRDLKSACTINDALAEVFKERQIYRIDHYLGKETVQNILVMRFANSIFEPLFNQRHVDHVQITVAEEEGVGTRAGYYEQAGALRDMVQNHLLQLVVLVAMEPPYALKPDVIRDEKLQVLRALRRIEGAAVDAQTVRGQYAAGFEFGRPVPGYREERGVDPDSRTETFVAIEAYIDNWRWAGVPFFLRTGKRLPKRATEIAVQLKDVPPILFNSDPSDRLAPDVLSIRIQPDEGFSFEINSKVPGPFSFEIDSKMPGPHINIDPVKMDFHYTSVFGSSTREAYERLLLDVMTGDATLFMRRDAVEASWNWLGPILERWAAQTSAPPPAYPAYEWGPQEAQALIASTGRRWRTP